MKRKVVVYRAESAAQSPLGGASKNGLAIVDLNDRVTPPSERKPIDAFTINEPSVDKARQIVSEFVFKRHRERPESMQCLADGGISVTLRAPRT